MTRDQTRVSTPGAPPRGHARVLTLVVGATPSNTMRVIVNPTPRSRSDVPNAAAP
jgi:hypothetical protein